MTLGPLKDSVLGSFTPPDWSGHFSVRRQWQMDAAPAPYKPSAKPCVGPQIWTLSADKMCQAQGDTLWETFQPRWAGWL